MHPRSASPLQLAKKLYTDRSQIIPFTSRNSQSQLSDHSIGRNVSQIIEKDKQKVTNFKQENRKKSLSSYYFKNCKKNAKNLDTQTFSKYLKDKNQNRKRSITTINLATNKTSLPTQISQPNQKVTDLNQELGLLQHTQVFCKTHPSKIAYFQEEQSANCYCHSCSIEYVKGNKRLIQLTPEIQQIKEVIKIKIEKTQKYGQKLCEVIKERIMQSVDSLQRQYNQLKMKISKEFQLQKDRNFVNFTLNQIDWRFIQRNKSMLQGAQKIPYIQFLQMTSKNYSVKKMQKVQQSSQEFTIHQFNSEFQLSPVPLITSAQKQRMVKYDNLVSKPKKNLIKQIQNALNYQYQPRKTKVKNISLKQGKSSSHIFNMEKQNIEPNILWKNHQAVPGQKEMRRLTFGNF